MSVSTNCVICFYVYTCLSKVKLNIFCFRFDIRMMSPNHLPKICAKKLNFKNFSPEIFLFQFRFGIFFCQKMRSLQIDDIY